MNAADYYGLEELRRSCFGFVQCCINVDTVCALLSSAERYIQYKCTKSLVQKVCSDLISSVDKVNKGDGPVRSLCLSSKGRGGRNSGKSDKRLTFDSRYRFSAVSYDT